MISHCSSTLSGVEFDEIDVYISSTVEKFAVQCSSYSIFAVLADDCKGDCWSGVDENKLYEYQIWRIKHVIDIPLRRCLLCSQLKSTINKPFLSCITAHQ